MRPRLQQAAGYQQSSEPRTEQTENTILPLFGISPLHVRASVLAYRLPLRLGQAQVYQAGLSRSGRHTRSRGKKQKHSTHSEMSTESIIGVTRTQGGTNTLGTDARSDFPPVQNDYRVPFSEIKGF